MPKNAHFAYVGDVPVESTFHGSAVLYRIFSTFSPGSLHVVESAANPSAVSRRLPDVRYSTLSVANGRLLHSRFCKFYFGFAAKRVRRYASRIGKLLSADKPDGIVTIVHGLGWLAAAEWAKRNDVPLHLIVHDDWIEGYRLSSRMADWFRREFEVVYRQCETRWCCSAFMADEFLADYDLPAELLMPTRASDALVFDSPAVRTSFSERGPTIVYGGTLTLPGYAHSLLMLARALERVRGKLVLYSPETCSVIADMGLTLPNIELRSAVSSNELIRICREAADALFVPMSFDAGQERNMKIAFPSKFADYTSVGVPILVSGPDYCSAVRFARQNDMAYVIDRNLQSCFNEAVVELLHSEDLRLHLAERAIAAGRESFDLKTAGVRFREALAA